jgi:hypothetical protein
MEDLKLKSAGGEIFAVSKLNTIELLGRIDFFYNEAAVQLKDWIAEFQQNNQEALKLIYKPAYFPMSPLYFPMINNNFDSILYPRNTYKFEDIPLQIAFKILKKYSFHIYGNDNHPHVVGYWDSGLIKFFGCFYSSYSIEVTLPLQAWLKLYFENAYKNIRLEFWMDYVNTIAQRRFAEILKILEIYQQASQNSIKIYWYHLDDDNDMLEMGNLIKKTTILDFKTIAVNKSLWKYMNKEFE